MKSKEEYFIELLKCLTIKTSDKYPGSVFYLYNDKVYMEHIEKNGYLFVNYDKIWSVFESKYSLNYKEIRELIKIQVEEHLKGVTPRWDWPPRFQKVEEHLKLKGVTPDCSLFFNGNTVVEEHLKLQRAF